MLLIALVVESRSRATRGIEKSFLVVVVVASRVTARVVPKHTQNTHTQSHRFYSAVRTRCACYQCVFVVAFSVRKQASARARCPRFVHTQTHEHIRSRLGNRARERTAFVFVFVCVCDVERARRVYGDQRTSAYASRASRVLDFIPFSHTHNTKDRRATGVGCLKARTYGKRYGFDSATKTPPPSPLPHPNSLLRRFRGVLSVCA